MFFKKLNCNNVRYSALFSIFSTLISLGAYGVGDADGVDSSELPATPRVNKEENYVSATFADIPVDPLATYILPKLELADILALRATSKGTCTVIDAARDRGNIFSGASLLHRSFPDDITSNLRSLPGSKITTLNVDGFRLNFNNDQEQRKQDIQDFAVKLCEVLPDTHITSLKVASTLLSDDHISRLITILPQTKITELTFNYVNIGNQQLGELANALPQTKINRMTISYCNQKGFRGMDHIIRMIQNANALESIDLNHSHITENEVQKILQAALSTHIKYIGLNDLYDISHYGESVHNLEKQLNEQGCVVDLSCEDYYMGDSFHGF